MLKILFNSDNIVLRVFSGAFYSSSTIDFWVVVLDHRVTGAQERAQLYFSMTFFFLSFAPFNEQEMKGR